METEAKTSEVFKIEEKRQQVKAPIYKKIIGYSYF